MRKEYKNFAITSRTKCLALWAMSCGLWAAGYGLWTMDYGLSAETNEEQLASSVLSQVRFIASKTKTLEELGKQTLSQAAIFLDMKESALPILHRALKPAEKNWKVRYWVCDLLGYIGNAETSQKLLQIVGDENEVNLTRRRALDSILEIERRESGIGKKELKVKLRLIAKKIKNARVKKKIQWTIKRLSHPHPDPLPSRERIGPK